MFGVSSAMWNNGMASEGFGNYGDNPAIEENSLPTMDTTAWDLEDWARDYLLSEIDISLPDNVGGFDSAPEQQTDGAQQQDSDNPG